MANNNLTVKTNTETVNAESLITEHLDVWTTAIKQKSSAGRGSSKKLSLHGIKKLRELILELAVRGKLVPQNPNDEPASVLLERIAAEKEQLLSNQGKEGKKPKKLPEISEEEKPFELPDGWEWSQNKKLFTLTKGKKPKTLSEQNIGFPYLDIEALDRNNVLRYTDDTKCPMSSVLDLIVVCDGSRSGLVLDGKDGVIGSTLAIINTPKYIQKFIKLFFQQAFQRLNSSMKGAAIPHLDTKALREGFLAFPPIEEQHRIVAKVDELMSLCDALEAQTESSLTAHQTLVETLLNALSKPDNHQEAFQQSWQRISKHFDTLFTTEHSIDQLKQTVLQLAVMGKLVPQDSNDEPASVLLERIAAEKADLIKQGKIKKQKPLLGITDDEKPFQLPKGWEWCRLGSLGYDMGGGTPSKSNSEYWDGDIPWISPKDMKRDFIDSSIDYVSNKAVENSTVNLIPENSLLMVVRGMILAHSFPVSITRKPVVINQDMKALVFNYLEPKFILLMMKGFKTEIVGLVDRSSHGTCKLVSSKLWSRVFIIPPLEEQHRIVAKVDELMALCDQLKARLSDAQTTQLQLADALTEQAL